MCAKAITPDVIAEYLNVVNGIAPLGREMLAPEPALERAAAQAATIAGWSDWGLAWGDSETRASHEASPAGSLCFPLQANGRPLGVLWFRGEWGEEGPSSLDREMGMALARAIEMAGEYRAKRVWAREQRTLYQRIFDAVPDAMLIASDEGRYREMNAAACRMLGYTREELLNLYAEDLIADPDPIELVRLRQELVSGGFRAELVLRRKDGSVFPAEIYACEVPIGGQRHFVGVHRDISVARQMQEQLQRRVAQMEALYHTSLALVGNLDLPQLLGLIIERAVELLDAAGGGLFLYDEREQALTLKALCRLPGRLLGMRLRRGQGIAGCALEQGCVLRTRDYEHAPYSVEQVADLHSLSAISVPLRWHGQIVGVMNLSMCEPERAFTDEDQRLVELFANYAAVAIAQARLFAQSQAAAEELRRANEELRQLDRLKDNFLATVTHELRRPLTNARLGLERLLGTTTRPFSAEQRELSQLVLQSIEEECSIVDDLLFVARLGEPAQGSFARFDLGPVVTASVMAATLRARNKGIKFTSDLCDAMIPVCGNSQHLSRALDHLLRNAIKFTPVGGQVHVSLERDAEGRAWVSVCDTGIGIAEAQQPYLFTRFYQVDSGNTRRYEGLGLGLMLVKQVVEQHGGQVEVKSTAGEGSIFTLRLPTLPEDGVCPGAPSA